MTDSIIKQYDNFADNFTQSDYISPTSRITLFKILNEIELRGKKILDMGCGGGTDLVYFQKTLIRFVVDRGY